MAAELKSDRAAWLQGPSARCEPSPEPSPHPWRIVLLGAPGVGKGTQADLLNKRLRACQANGRSACDLSPAMPAALEYMRRGDLLPDSTVWDMMRERSTCLHCGGGFILEGFPRTLNQAHSLNELMENEGLELTAVVNCELPVVEIIARLGGRQTCAQCKTVFHATERPSRVTGICDRSGGKLFQREDDRPESTKIRMEVYEQSTASLIEFYRSLGLLLPVAARGTPEEICEKTLVTLNSWCAQRRT